MDLTFRNRAICFRNRRDACPIGVELRALEHADFVRILSETWPNSPQQYKALMITEEVSLDFTDDAIDAIARIAVGVNATVEDIVLTPM